MSENPSKQWREAYEAQARRIAAEWVAAQLSTAPVDEAEVEAWLRQVYQVEGLAPPTIRWLDGPLQLVLLLLGDSVRNDQETRIGNPVYLRMPGWHSDSRDSVGQGVYDTVQEGVWDRLGAAIRDVVWDSVRERVQANRWAGRDKGGEASLWARVWDAVEADNANHPVDEGVWNLVGNSLWHSFDADTHGPVRASVEEGVCASVLVYETAPKLAVAHFYAAALGATSEWGPFAQVNARVSGYWLSRETALLVRRPRRLALDAAGRWHSATGKCLEYPDGWGFYAWHGVRVPEHVILAPEGLKRKDYLNEPNVEVRRVIQERMGRRFVRELGGRVIDSGPRGTLYEVALPNDPERVARYVQVQDASTPRRYFLRVPPTVQTAAEAVAWGFQLSVEEYSPAHET